MSARDEMMKTLVDFTSFPGGVADEVLQTLASAGYRILGPDEVAAIETGFREAVHFVRNNAMDIDRDYPEIVAAEAAIRSLKGGRS